MRRDCHLAAILPRIALAALTLLAIAASTVAGPPADHQPHLDRLTA